MASEANWVEDVRRWYRAGAQAMGSNTVQILEPHETDLSALGYEAAHPALQARNWPDAQGTGFEPMR